jgi:hypothetical protein
VFKFGHDAYGGPLFTQVANTTETSVFGVGPPTITTYKDQPGTGIVWSTVSSLSFLSFCITKIKFLTSFELLVRSKVG